MLADLKLDLRLLGRALRGTREKVGISLRTLSKDCGISPSQIVRIESGEFDCLLSSLVRIGAALGVRISDLIEVCVNPDYDLYQKALLAESATQLPAGLANEKHAAKAINGLVFGGAVILASLFRSSHPKKLAREFDYPSPAIADRFLAISESLEEKPPSLTARRWFLEKLQAKPEETLQYVYNFPSEQLVRTFLAVARRRGHRPDFLWWPMRGTSFLDYSAPGREEKGLTPVTDSGNSPAVLNEIKKLRARLNRVCEPRGSGKQKELAAFLGVSMPRISEWLAGRREPSGETALRMFAWVEDQEKTKRATVNKVKK